MAPWCSYTMQSESVCSVANGACARKHGTSRAATLSWLPTLRSAWRAPAPAAVGWTPLHCAVSNGEDAACKQLCDAGADPTRKDSEGKSSMDLAKHFGNQVWAPAGSRRSST